MSLAPQSNNVEPSNVGSEPITATTTHPRPLKKKGRQASSLVAPTLLKPPNQNNQQKKVLRRSSKPIINWFQRKLSGTVKAKRVENLPLTIADLGMGRAGQNPVRVAGRVASSPLPSPSYNGAYNGGKHQSKLDSAALSKRRTISLYEDDEFRGSMQSYGDDNISVDRSSFARDSLWSPSALEADDDASVRPLPPSTPPSPSPSRSSSSYLSDPRTFRSIAASTKPTTLMSIDLNGNGMAHIAQAPPTTSTHLHRIAPHVRQSSSLSNPGHPGNGTSITFSPLPAQPSSRTSSLRNPGSLNSLNLNLQHNSLFSGGTLSPVQAPLHTTHHPRNNPRPSSPPLDNASMLTLASSAYAMPGRSGLQGFSSTASAIGDSLSQDGGSLTYPDAESTSQFVLEDDDRLEERDVDASVRALRPRSSRRGSWESEASRWSARVQLGTGTSSLARDRSLWTTNSIRTGGFSAGDGDAHQHSEDVVHDSDSTHADNATGVETSVYNPSVFVEDADTNKQLLDTVEASGNPRACQPEDEQPEEDSLKLPIATHRLSSDTVAQLAISSSLPSTPEAAAGP
jgi:hypothetical protein